MIRGKTLYCHSQNKLSWAVYAKCSNILCRLPVYNMYTKSIHMYNPSIKRQIKQGLQWKGQKEKK